MTVKEYEQDCLRTLETDGKTGILQGLLGLGGETGECMDILKKHMFQGHAFDKGHMARELGDVAWYLAISANAIGYSLEDIFRINMEKRKERYPDGFESDRSVNRDKNDI
jgi:NTP pyrophosphatase (non-canonical NTP hydrolase)